jgi:hypothetical protein
MMPSPDSGGLLRFQKSFSKNALALLGFYDPGAYRLIRPEEIVDDSPGSEEPAAATGAGETAPPRRPMVKPCRHPKSHLTPQRLTPQRLTPQRLFPKRLIPKRLTRPLRSRRTSPSGFWRRCGS